MEMDNLEVEVSIGSYIYLKCTMCKAQCETFRKWQSLFKKGEGCEYPDSKRD
jgi:hypothetical protein